MATVAQFPQNELVDSHSRGLLEQLAASLDERGLIWASGYLAGAAAQPSAGTAAGEPAPEAESAATLDIWYGSQTGNARSVAEALQRDAQARGLAARVSSLADVRPREIQKIGHLALVVSTHGDGDPPDDAEALYEHLFGRKAPKLDGLSYSVLALGDSSYEHYCKIGRDFDRRLEELGAQRLFERRDCDVDFESPASDWRAGVLERAERLLDRASAPTGPSLAVVPDAPAHDREHPFKAELLEIQGITGRGSSKDVRHVELSLEDSGLQYQPGDSLGVWSRNPQPTVDRLAGLLSDDPEQVITLGDETLPLAHWLSRRLEITLVSRAFVERYAELVDSAALKELLAGPAKALASWLKERQVVDVVAEHPPADGVGVADVLACLRALTPRLYSIASSPLTADDEVHLTVDVVGYERDGHRYSGAASGYLADGVAEGDTVEVYIEPNERFRLPRDPAKPIVMIGPGTGVAPFRAFVEHREAQGASGESWLFFGDRRKRTDFLYQLEWQDFLKRGALSRLDVAFSRDGAEKVYVQHRLRERGGELYEWLQRGAHLYVCGDAERMAPDVHQALIDIVAEHGGHDTDDAKAYLAELKREGRYQRDVY